MWKLVELLEGNEYNGLAVMERETLGRIEKGIGIFIDGEIENVERLERLEADNGRA